MRMHEDLRMRGGTAAELLMFFWRRKWWWITPLIGLMLLLGFVLVATQGSALAPFIYTLF